MSKSHGSRYIRNDKVSLPKEEQRDLLFQESAGCCYLCGRKREDIKDWSMVKIQRGGTGKEASVEGRAIICSNCVGDKHSMGVSEYAGTLSFGKRWAYWLRVKAALLSGRISRYKAGLLMEDFSLLRRGKPNKKDKKALRSFSILAKETDRCCIYCGTPLTIQAVTYDHIIPRSLGGSRGINNIVTACESCNGAKSSLTVDEFVATFPESQRLRYIKRVKRLADNHQLPEGKAKALLSFQTQHSRKYRFRLFRRIYTITVKAQEV
ncbi:MAG: HNH endonuclease [Prevotella sp.]|nr:HNH endonuclease [Prevotella sp.]